MAKNNSSMIVAYVLKTVRDYINDIGHNEHSLNIDKSTKLDELIEVTIKGNYDSCFVDFIFDDEVNEEVLEQMDERDINYYFILCELINIMQCHISTKIRVNNMMDTKRKLETINCVSDTE